MPNVERVVWDQILLWMKNQSLLQRERLKLEPGLMMHQVLKEAVTLEKEEQGEAPLVTTPSAVAPVKNMAHILIGGSGERCARDGHWEQDTCLPFPGRPKLPILERACPKSDIVS